MATPEGKVVELKPKVVRPPLHIACYGGAGARKSTFFATMPQPIVIACFDAIGKDTPDGELVEVQAPKRSKLGIAKRQVLDRKKRRVAASDYYHDPLVDNPVAAAAVREWLNQQHE